MNPVENMGDRFIVIVFEIPLATTFEFVNESGIWNDVELAKYSEESLFYKGDEQNQGILSFSKLYQYFDGSKAANEIFSDEFLRFYAETVL